MCFSSDKVSDKTATSSTQFVCAAIFTVQLIFFFFPPLICLCLFEKTAENCSQPPHRQTLPRAAAWALTLCWEVSWNWRLRCYLLTPNRRSPASVGWDMKKNISIRKPFLNTAYNNDKVDALVLIAGWQCAIGSCPNVYLNI